MQKLLRKSFRIFAAAFFHCERKGEFMRNLVTCRQMKGLDLATIEKMGVPSLVLMERAALSVAEEMIRKKELLSKTLVVCGTGNNGGDGIAIARILYLWGYDVSLYLMGKTSKMSEETRIQKKIADNYDVPWVNNPCWDEYTTIVDAIFGIGLTRDVQGEYANVIDHINDTGAYVWAVDIPSGINGDTGAVMGHAVLADQTVTFAFGKAGLYLYPGAGYCGQVLVKDIGIYQDAKDDKNYIKALEWEDLCRLPQRSPDGNKGTFGKVLVAAGSCGMAGAVYFAARAALTCGAGMVKIHTVEENRVILQQQLPEALLYTDEWQEDDQTKALLETEWQKNLDWADVLVLGPGIAKDSRARSMVRFYLEHCKKPIVLDADGLNILSDTHALWEYCDERCILTPHLGELSRLTGTPIDELKRDLVTAARRFATEHNITCVAKDSRTVTVTAEGETYLNLSGNEGMATAGSGDVLSGIIGGLLAQQTPLAFAAQLGVYLHGLSGDQTGRNTGRRSMSASGIIQGLAGVLKKIEE